MRIAIAFSLVLILPTLSQATADGAKRAMRTNNVEIDDRGYIYLVGRAGTGLHIV